MKAQYALHYGKAPDLWPVVVGMKDENTDIFSVPTENAVGTNSLNNAITLLKFNKDQIVYDEVRKDFIEGVGSGDKFYPGIFSDIWIGYTQTRGFLLFNLKDKSFADHIVLKPSYEWITNVNVIDSAKFQFLFQVCRSDELRFLRVFEFDGKGNFKQISELQAGPHKVGYLEPWAIQNKTIFVYNNDSIKMTAFDINFKPVQHPFCDLFNGLKNFRCLDEMVIHPTLPFAILVEMDRDDRANYKVWLARWDHPEEKERCVELLGQDISMFSKYANIKHLVCTQFEFSPDGKWLLFRDHSEYAVQKVDSPIFVTMPVSADNPLFLGKPKFLGRVLRENARPTSTAWIQKPQLSFVASDGKVLYKWELENLPK